MATLPVSSRSTSTSSTSGEVVQAPVELPEADLERVLFQHILLRCQEPRPGKGKDGALDWAAAREGGRRTIRVDGRELLLAPREDGRRRDLVGGAVDVQAVLAVHALRGRLGELRFE